MLFNVGLLSVDLEDGSDSSSELVVHGYLFSVFNLNYPCGIFMNT